MSLATSSVRLGILQSRRGGGKDWLFHHRTHTRRVEHIPLAVVVFDFFYLF